MSSIYDVVVIGGGPAGENAASRAVEHGLSAAIVEDELVGGECSFWACMPSKALLKPPQALAAARAQPGAAAAASGDLDVDAVLASRTQFAENWDDAPQVIWVESAGVALHRGRGRISGPREVTVTRTDGSAETLTASRGIVVATGATPKTPPVDGLSQVRTWSSRDATSAKHIPRRLLVLGGGVVGCELAQAFKRLGSEEVTVVNHGPTVLAAEEPFVGREVGESLETDGVELILGASLSSVSRASADAPVHAHCTNGTELVADELLVATGRRSATGDIGLDTVGLTPGEPVPVDGSMQARGVDGGWLYAVGDAAGFPLLTHMGKYEARQAADAIAGRDVSAWASDRAVTRVVFTDPEVAAVGYTEAVARDRGLSVRTVQVGSTGTAGGALLGDVRGGSAQMVIDTDRAVVVGVTLVGPGVSELLHAATVAVAGEVPLERLWHAVPVFPTMSELWLRLLEKAGV